ncbi:MAG: phage head morphogenesis protein, partial [Chloroflexota bacterium]|nr:phage head morphogenesis protein [Chloroflexota bacterium]
MSDLDAAIRNARRGIDDREAPIRGQLRDAYSGAVDALTVDIELVTARIRDARAAGETVTRDWLRREARYRRLLRDAEREFARFTDDGLRVIRDGQVAAVSGGAAEAWELMEAAGIETGFGGRVNTGAVENLVSAFDPASPLRGVLDSYGENGAKVIEDVLTQGVIDGTGPRQIVKRITDELTDGSTKARLDALVRTEMMRAFRASSNEQYAQRAHLIRGYRRTAQHGPR